MWIRDICLMMKTTSKIVFIQGPVIVNVRTGELLKVCPEGAM